MKARSHTKKFPIVCVGGSGEVEAVGLFDPEHVRFARINGRPGFTETAIARDPAWNLTVSRAPRAAWEKSDDISSCSNRRTQEDVGSGSGRRGWRRGVSV